MSYTNFIVLSQFTPTRECLIIKKSPKKSAVFENGLFSVKLFRSSASAVALEPKLSWQTALHLTESNLVLDLSLLSREFPLYLQKKKLFVKDFLGELSQAMGLLKPKLPRDFL
jgi:hypothetical protein